MRSHHTRLRSKVLFAHLCHQRQECYWRSLSVCLASPRRTRHIHYSMLDVSLRLYFHWQAKKQCGERQE